jgi:hypothetical protein
MKNKQTAVDFLYEFVLLKLSNEEQMQFEGLFQQANQIEKEQIKDAFDSGYFNYKVLFHDNAEEYYNETYNVKDN